METFLIPHTFLYLHWSSIRELDAVYLYDGEFHYVDLPKLGISISELSDACSAYGSITEERRLEQIYSTDDYPVEYILSNNVEQTLDYLPPGPKQVEYTPLLSLKSVMAIGADLLHDQLQWWLEDNRDSALEREVIKNLSTIQGILNRARHA